MTARVREAVSATTVQEQKIGEALEACGFRSKGLSIESAREGAGQSAALDPADPKEKEAGSPSNQGKEDDGVVRSRLKARARNGQWVDGRSGLRSPDGSSESEAKGLDEADPTKEPEVLYHGTLKKNWDSIWTQEQKRVLLEAVKQGLDVRLRSGAQLREHYVAAGRGPHNFMGIQHSKVLWIEHPGSTVTMFMGSANHTTAARGNWEICWELQLKKAHGGGPADPFNGPHTLRLPSNDDGRGLVLAPGAPHLNPRARLRAVPLNISFRPRGLRVLSGCQLSEGSKCGSPTDRFSGVEASGTMAGVFFHVTWKT
eukprot:s3642_g1.t1